MPIFDPLTGDPATGAGERSSRQRDSRRSHQPDRAADLANVPAPNIAGAFLGSVNYQDATVRERRTDGFDVKFGYQLSPRISCPSATAAADRVRARQLRRQRIGRPYQGGFIAGVNKTQSAAGNWTRTLTNTFVMDARFGQHRSTTRRWRRQRPEHRRRRRHSGRQPGHLHQRDDDHQPAGPLEPDGRLLDVDAVESR